MFSLYFLFIVMLNHYSYYTILRNHALAERKKKIFFIFKNILQNESYTGWTVQLTD